MISYRFSIRYDTVVENLHKTLVIEVNGTVSYSINHILCLMLKSTELLYDIL